MKTSDNDVIVLMPHVELWSMTEQALEDALNLSQVPQVLCLNNGPTQQAFQSAEVNGHPKLLRWHHYPPLVTLNASWNAMLDYAWAAGFKRALVVNNDVRLLSSTAELLSAVMTETDALFVTAVGVRPAAGESSDEFAEDFWALRPTLEDLLQAPKGGPDYSCFLISEQCHRLYRFDDKFTYFGDNDHHYRMKLDGDGARIFGVQLPFWHFGSRTVNRSDEERARYARVFEAHRAEYLRKWGGLGGEEQWTTPYLDEVLREIRD